MIKQIYGKVLTVLGRKPWKLWGLSLLACLLVILANALFLNLPGVGLAIALLFEAALVIVFLRGYLNEELHTVQLFDCFKDWKTIKRVLCGMGYMYLWIFLWSLIPFAGIVFAIIRAYEYRLTPYILVMEPDVPITEAYKVSRKRTQGFKAKMFWADLLWVLIVCGAFLVLVLLALIPYVGFVFGIAAFLLYLFMCLFGPLVAGLIQSAFYVQIQRAAGEGPQFDDSMNNPPEKVKPVKAAAPVPAPGEFKFCPECGTRNPQSGKFCTGCGHKFAAPEAPVPDVPVPAVSVPEVPAPEYPPVEYPPVEDDPDMTILP